MRQVGSRSHFGFANIFTIASLRKMLTSWYTPRMTPELSIEIEIAVEQHHGCLQVKGQRSAYVVMSIETFRDVMGVGTDEELQESLADVEQGLADVEAGRTRPMEAFLREFDALHGILR